MTNTKLYSYALRAESDGLLAVVEPDEQRRFMFHRQHGIRQFIDYCRRRGLKRDSFSVVDAEIIPLQVWAQIEGYQKLTVQLIYAILPEMLEEVLQELADPAEGTNLKIVGPYGPVAKAHAVFLAQCAERGIAVTESEADYAKWYAASVPEGTDPVTGCVYLIGECWNDTDLLFLGDD